MSASPRGARLLVISPVRDEAANVERLARSVLAQTRAPDLWVVVDDGSEDETASVLQRATRSHPWIRVLSVPSQASGLDNEARLARAAEARAFNWALAHVDAGGDFTHVAKLDGDIELPPEYYARVLDEFERDPALGVAGGGFAEQVRGQWRTVREPPTHVAGALKVYRRDCLESVGGLREHLGWDTIDETTARMRGFATRTMPDLVARHHRPMGSVGGQLRGRWRYGTCAYGAGYPPMWVALRALKVARLPPRGLSAIAFVGGYLAGRRRRAPCAAEPEYRAFLRGELRERMRRRLRPSPGRDGLDQVVRYEPVRRLASELGGGTLLDVGSGSSGVARWLPAAWTVTAVDADFRDYGAASGPAYDGVHRVLGDARRLPFADASFDVVLALDLLEHVPAAQRRRVLRELRRVARRRVIVACPVGAAALDADRRLAATYRRKGHAPPGWLVEHLAYGFPERADLEQGLAGFGRLTIVGSESVAAHERLMRAQIGRTTQHLAYAAARILRAALCTRGVPHGVAAPVVALLRGADRAPTYRAYAILDLQPRGTSVEVAARLSR